MHSMRQRARDVRSVHRGDAILGAGIAARMARYFAHLTPTVEDAFPELTKTERDILRLLAEVSRTLRSPSGSTWRSRGPQQRQLDPD